MKILIDARTLGKRPSGVGMYLYNFICGLMQYDTMKMELLTDVVESAAMKELDEAHIPIHRYGTPVEKSIGVYAYFRFVQNKINEVKPDLVLGSEQSDAGGHPQSVWKDGSDCA